MNMPRTAILDTDIGTDIDDTWALAMLLASPELDLRLVTCVSGDVECRAGLCAGLLSVARRRDVPIGLGIGGPLLQVATGWRDCGAFEQLLLDRLCW